MDLFDAFEDDLEVVELLELGIPRHIYSRANPFENLSDQDFFQKFRLTKKTTLFLLAQIETRLEFPSDMNAAVSPLNQLLTTLYLFGTGGHLSSVSDFMGMHSSTVSRIVERVSKSIAGLRPQYIKMPQTESEIRQSKYEFYKIAKFPRVVGALGGTHIRIQSPGGEDAEAFRNRKQYFSIIVQAVCNSNMEFTNIVARWPGSVHNVTIFNNSVLRQNFENGEYPDSIILGDYRYKVHPYLLTPVLKAETPSEQLYNEAHSQTRNVIERTFVVWKRRFPILAYGCRLKQETILAMIVACAVLHNVAQKMGEGIPPLPAEIDEHQLKKLIEAGNIGDPPVDNHNSRSEGQKFRSTLIENFFGRM